MAQIDNPVLVDSPNLTTMPTQNICPLPVDPKRKPNKNASFVWDHFTKLPNCKPGELRAACNYCKQDYACETKKCGTSTLKNHLENQCKKYPYRLECKKQKVLAFETALGGGTIGGNLMAVGFSKEACRKALVVMIFLDELPFNFVEGEGFRKFCTVACPKFVPPSRRTIARDVYQLYMDEKKKLKTLFASNKQRVCLTTDTWTSLQNTSYMVITAHFIDKDWAYHKRILNFCIIANHKGESIGKLIETCLLDWGIEKVFTITVDNASANDVAVQYVIRKVNNWKGCVLDGEFMHLRCCAHIVNLIVTDGLKDMHASIISIRNAVRYIRSSPSRFDKFKACVEKEKLESKAFVCLDVPTRWNSTYMMLANAIKFQKAFGRLEEDDGQYVSYFQDVVGEKKREGPPTWIDWENTKVFLRFLKSFYDVTCKFSGSLSVTSNITFHEMCGLQCELKTLSDSDDPLLGSMAKNMKKKYEKYWGLVESINNILIIAVVLDPRYKLEYVSFCFSDVYDAGVINEKVSGIKSLLIRLYDFYCTSLPMGGQSSNGVATFNATAAPIGNYDHYQSTRLARFAQMRKQKDIVEIKSEVERYLLDPAENIENEEKFDIRNWWRVNSTRYPVLSLLARDVFAVPISTVASESAFSTGGRIIDHFRSSLTPKMVEALICGQNWLRSFPISLESELFTEDMEFYDQVESVEIEGQVQLN